MTIFQNSAEGQTSGTAATGSNTGAGSGDAFSFVALGGASAMAFDSTRSAHGTNSYKATPVASQSINAAYSGLAASAVAIRFYLYLTANTADDTYLVRCSNTGGGTRLASLHLDSTNKLVLRGTGANVWTSTAALALNTWHRIEFFDLVASGTAGQLRAAYYPLDSTTATDSYTNNATDTGTTAIDQAGLIKQNTSLYATPFWVDDIRVHTGSDAVGLIGPLAANTAPSVSVSAAQLIPAGTTATVSMTATDSDGTIASRSWAATSWPSGASAPTVTAGGSPTGATASTTALTVPGVYTFTASATDNGGATTTAVATVYVYAVDGSTKVRAVRAGSTWTGATVSAFNDTSDATYGESVSAPVNAPVTLDMDPVGAGSAVFTGRARLQPTGGAASTLKVELLQGGAGVDTVVASQTFSLGDTFTDYNLTLSSGENSTFNNRSLFALRLTANQT